MHTAVKSFQGQTYDNEHLYAHARETHFPGDIVTNIHNLLLHIIGDVSHVTAKTQSFWIEEVQ